MARTPRVLKSEEAAPAEPDLVADAPSPREATLLFGHEDATAALAAAFAAAPPQALLLEGPRGIGKATLAFRLARALLSAPPGAALAPDLGSDPDGRAAHQIAAGTHPGLLHLTRPWDPEKKRFKQDITVEDVRRLVPFFGGTAADGGWRVVIVDAADDLNPSSANALLKALEEPPRRALFLLVAHVSGRVLPTIRSRCRAVRLRPLPDATMRRGLAALGADPQLAEAAEGSVRRGLTLAATGADAVRLARRLTSAEAIRDGKSHHALADLAASRRDGEFAAIVEMLLDAFAARVRDGAGRLPLAVLETYAAAYLEATTERARVEEYNLDKRETVLALCARLAAADRAAGRA